MKTYVKPGISVMRLLQEERIAVGFKWLWNGNGPEQAQVDKEYEQYLKDHGYTTFAWTCGYDVVS